MVSHTIASLMNNKTKLKCEKLNYAFFVYFYILYILSYYISLIGIMFAYIINQTKYFFFLSVKILKC